NQNPADRWIRFAVASGLIEDGTRLLAQLANDPYWRGDPSSLNYLRNLAIMIGVQGHQTEAGAMLDYLQNAKLDAITTFSLCGGFGAGLRQGGSALALVDPQHRLQLIYDDAVSATLSSWISPNVRIAALQTRAVSPLTEVGYEDMVQLALASGEPQEV